MSVHQSSPPVQSSDCRRLCLPSSTNKVVHTAVEVGVPKLGNYLESLETAWKCSYTCAQASAQFVHSMCTSMDTPCTLELYTCCGQIGHWLGHMCTFPSFPSSFQVVSKLGHSNSYSSVSVPCTRLMMDEVIN